MSVFLTAKFKIHNPSRRKQAIFDRALEEYTHAYAELLAWAKDNLPLLEEKGKYRERYSETAIRRLLPKVSALKNYHLHSSARDALLVDVAGALTSYFRLRDEVNGTSFPTCRDPAPETYPNALQEFATIVDDEEGENQRRARLLKVARGDVMPIYFSRPDGVPQNRNFSLIYDEEKSRYYGLMYLEPGRDGVRLEPSGNLVRMGWPQGRDPTDPRPHLTARSSGAVVVPLALGRWHVETFLGPCLDGAANVRSAFLSRDGTEGRREYYLHVTFEFFPEKTEVETYLGVDRGLANLIAITVIDAEENIIHQELHPGADLIDFQKYVFTEYQKRQRRGRDLSGQMVMRRANEEVCHRLANRIVAVALEHKSQVVVEDLKWFKERKRDFGMLKRTPLQRVQDILVYKLPMKGLPAPKTVSAAYTSKECPRCGYGRDVTGRKVNRPSQAEFCCEQCGYETHADLNGSHNVARRWLEVLAKRRERTLKTA